MCVPRVTLVDTYCFTRAGLTQVLQQHDVAVVAVARIPVGGVAPGDVGVVVEHHGGGRTSVRVHRPGHPVVDLAGDALDIRSLLDLVLSRVHDVPSVPPQRAPDSLTGRELEVLAGLTRGGSSRVIAAELGIRPATVNNHKTSIYAKLRVHNQAQAVAIALDRGILERVR